MDTLSLLSFRHQFHDQTLWETDLKQIFIGSIVWGLFYLVIRFSNLSFILGEQQISQKKDLDLRNRLVSFFHGIGAIYFSSFEFFRGNPVCGAMNTEQQRFLMIFSSSYFIYDTICMTIEGLMDKAMLIHHPLALLGVMLPLYENIQGNFVMHALFLTELSNPAMHFRHLLRLSGRIHTKAYELCELTFISLYFYARFIAVGPTIYKTQICGLNHPLVKVSCLVLFVQSLFFISQMYLTLQRRINEVLIRKENCIKLNWFTALDKAAQTELESLYNKSKQIN